MSFFQDAFFAFFAPFHFNKRGQFFVIESDYLIKAQMFVIQLTTIVEKLVLFAGIGDRCSFRYKRL